MDGIIDSMDMSLSKLRELLIDREAWRAVVNRVTKSRTQLRTELIIKSKKKKKRKRSNSSEEHRMAQDNVGTKHITK